MDRPAAAVALPSVAVPVSWEPIWRSLGRAGARALSALRRIVLGTKVGLTVDVRAAGHPATVDAQDLWARAHTPVTARRTEQR